MKSCDIPNLGLLFRFGWGYNAGLPTGLLFGPRLAISFVFTVGLVLWWRAGEALRAHNSRNILLATLLGLGNSLRYYPVGFLLLVLQSCLHLIMRPPWCSLLRWGAGWGWGWRWWWRRGGWRAALQWRTENPYLVARTISILSGLKKKHKTLFSI